MQIENGTFFNQIIIIIEQLFVKIEYIFMSELLKVVDIRF